MGPICPKIGPKCSKIGLNGELFKICQTRSGKEKQLGVIEKNTDWKTESMKLYLITINGKVTEKENETV
ncbi:hypothetical protein B9Z55_027890 [Caenorhabditis nigoni]|uniref:Uncharacterized protein n=1 Tax=Caenorhabditis nigoni TaxID=1611254 RepID=A0A2G5SE91_9PELO|nr:hypothetical protein B9Z55_027890 [Caenorhabditis nigoni]